MGGSTVLAVWLEAELSFLGSVWSVRAATLTSSSPITLSTTPRGVGVVVVGRDMEQYTCIETQTHTALFLEIVWMWGHTVSLGYKFTPINAVQIFSYFVHFLFSVTAC